MISQLDSHHRYINIQWICKECKAWFWLLKNSHIWLGTSPVVLKFILLFFHFVVCNCLFAKNIHCHSAIGENDRMLSTICVFKRFWFSSGNLCRLTCDLGSLSLLSNRADSLVTSVPSKVRNCAEPPDRLRSEISFLRTCNIPNLISHIHRIALPKRFTGCVSTWLHGCEIACTLKQTFAQCKIFLQGHWHRRSLTSRTCVDTLINETKVKYEATWLSIWDIAIDPV